jgi:hypothetical protein
MREPYSLYPPYQPQRYSSQGFAASTYGGYYGSGVYAAQFNEEKKYMKKEFDFYLVQGKDDESPPCNGIAVRDNHWFLVQISSLGLYRYNGIRSRSDDIEVNDKGQLLVTGVDGE